MPPGLVVNKMDAVLLPRWKGGDRERVSLSPQLWRCAVFQDIEGWKAIFLNSHNR